MKSSTLFCRFLCVIMFSSTDWGALVMTLLGIRSKASVKVSKSNKSPQLAQVTVVSDLLSCANCPPTLICMIAYI